MNKRGQEEAGPHIGVQFLMTLILVIAVAVALFFIFRKLGA
jgi:hypothetical protein